MSQVLDYEFQSMVANAICHEAQMASASIQSAVAAHERPSVMFRPAISIDGDRWCALYGENLQDGVAGFGSSPEAAMHDFDASWRAALKGKP